MPLNYIEKGIGLQQAIYDAGHWVRQNNRIWECSDEAAVQAIIDAYPISNAIAEKKAEIDEYGRQLRIKIAGKETPEWAAWSIKSAQAAKYLETGNPLDAPDLAEEATHRNATLESVVTRVSTNSSALMPSETRISGVLGKHKDILTAMDKLSATPEEFRAVIDYYAYKTDPELPQV